MNARSHDTCYGNLFPDMLDGSNDHFQKGKVFSYVLRSPGGLQPAAREISIDMEAWDRCTQCPEFENCYKLSMAKLAFENAIASR